MSLKLKPLLKVLMLLTCCSFCNVYLHNIGFSPSWSAKSFTPQVCNFRIIIIRILISLLSSKTVNRHLPNLLQCIRNNSSKSKRPGKDLNCFGGSFHSPPRFRAIVSVHWSKFGSVYYNNFLTRRNDSEEDASWRKRMENWKPCRWTSDRRPCSKQ